MLVVSWAHQRTRELGDRLVDDAHTVRRRFSERCFALRRAGRAIVDAVLDVPTTSRERLTWLTFRSRRAVSNALAPVVDLPWMFSERGAWIRARRGRIVALASAPLVPAIAVIIALSSRSGEGAPPLATLTIKQDASPSAAVKADRGEMAALRQARFVTSAAARSAQAQVDRRLTVPSVTPASVAGAVEHRTGPARTAARPKAVAPAAVSARARRKPSPRAGLPPAVARVRPAVTVPAGKPEAVPVVPLETGQQQSPQQDQTVQGELPNESVPSAPATPPATENPPSTQPVDPPATPPTPPAGSDDGDEGDEDDDEKPNDKSKEKGGHDDAGDEDGEGDEDEDEDDDDDDDGDGD